MIIRLGTEGKREMASHQQKVNQNDYLDQDSIMSSPGGILRTSEHGKKPRYNPQGTWKDTSDSKHGPFVAPRRSKDSRLFFSSLSLSSSSSFFLCFSFCLCLCPCLFSFLCLCVCCVSGCVCGVVSACVPVPVWCVYM